MRQNPPLNVKDDGHQIIVDVDFNGMKLLGVDPRAPLEEVRAKIKEMAESEDVMMPASCVWWFHIASNEAGQIWISRVTVYA